MTKKDLSKKLDELCYLFDDLQKSVRLDYPEKHQWERAEKLELYKLKLINELDEYIEKAWKYDELG